MVMSSQFAPPSVEYCSLVTATSSVAVTFRTVGAVCVNQPLLPVDVDGAAGGFPLRCGAAVGVNVPTFNTGAVVSVPWADAFGTTASAAPTTAAVANKRCTLSPLLGPDNSTGPPTKQQAGHSCQPQRTPSST